MADLPNQSAQAIINILNAVDFSHSGLPSEILNDRERGIPFCKLEFSTKVQLVKRLGQCRLPDRVDILPLDKRLLELAERFEGYVRAGDAASALMTHDALVRGIHDIRCNFPKNPAVPPEEFVRINAEYLDQWLVLIQFAEKYDRLTRSLSRQRELNQAKHAELDQSIEHLSARVETDPDFCSAFFHIREHDSLDERLRWTPAQREVHTLLVDHRLEQAVLEMSNLQLASMEQEQLAVRQNIETMQVQLAGVPIVTDPELMRKYRDSIQSFTRSVEASDALFEETARQMGAYSRILQELDQTDSVSRQNAAAMDGARTIMQKLS